MINSSSYAEVRHRAAVKAWQTRRRNGWRAKTGRSSATYHVTQEQLTPEVTGPVKPPFSYYGGKAKHADWIVSHFPAHKVYVEVFGGSAAVLLHKSPAKMEVYNDLHDSVVNFFRVVRDEDSCRKLVASLDHTPYARGEHTWCRQNFGELKADPVEWARAYYLLIEASYNSKFGNVFRTSGDANRNRVGQFRQYRSRFAAITQRFADGNVVVENRGFEKLIPQYDGPDVLFYLDPPYVFDVRGGKGRRDYYAEDGMEDADHVRLLELACAAKGRVVISGYKGKLYDQYLAGWRAEERRTTVITAGRKAAERIEVLWLNF